MSWRTSLCLKICLTALVLWGTLDRAQAQQPAGKNQTQSPSAVTSGGQPPSPGTSANLPSTAETNAGQTVKPDDRVVLSVGDEKITAADVDRIIQALPPSYRSYYASRVGKRELPQYLIKMKILVAEARKHKLEERPEVQRAIEIARESVLADAARKEIEKGIPVTDQQVQELYEKRKAEFEEAHIRRILIRTDKSILPSAAPTRPPLPSDQARKKLEGLRKEILAGADFAQVAQANSEDLSTAGVGGDMGYINRQTVVPPIADAALTLNPGQVSDIIPTPYGLEIIKVEERRAKPLKDVKPVLEAKIRQDKFEDELKKIQEKDYKVNLDFDYWGVRVEATALVPASPPESKPPKKN